MKIFLKIYDCCKIIKIQFPGQKNTNLIHLQTNICYWKRNLKIVKALRNLCEHFREDFSQ